MPANVDDDKHYAVKVIMAIKFSPTDKKVWRPGPGYTMSGAAIKAALAVEGQADALEVGDEVTLA